MLDASHVVVFCAKTAMDDAWLKLVVDREDAGWPLCHAGSESRER